MVQLKATSISMLQRQSYLDVSARYLFFENATHLQFQRSRFCRDAEVKIEKAVVHRLQAQ